MLDPLDHSWNRVDPSYRMANFTTLPAGHYTLRVHGSNNRGVWNEQGVTLRLEILPPWWSTNWFRALCVGLFLALLWAAYQARMRRVQHAFEATLEARVGERTRIARELHDTLLQSFHGSASALPDGVASVAGEPIGRETAARHGHRTGGGGDHGRARCRAGITVIHYRKERSRAGDQHPRSRSRGRGPQPETGLRRCRRRRVARASSIVRDEIYKIAAEALRNAFRHAHAAKVEVEIRYDDEQFRLRVRDDGKGIDRAVLANQGLEGHYGLRGMPERAAPIGGKLAVWSEAGAGTEVELRLPARIVYSTSPRRTWWSRLWGPKTPANRRGDAS